MITQQLPLKFSFRQLVPEDWETFKNLRLESLEVARGMFGGSSFEQASRIPDESWQEKLSSNKNIFYALFKDKNAVGLMAVMEHNETDQEAFVSSIYLNPETRGQGLTHYLFEQSIIAAKNRKYKILWCSTREGNKAIIAVCEKFGFRYSHTVEKQWNDNTKAGLVYYKLEL